MKEVLKTNEKQMKTLGWIATFMSVMMYVSYIPQIMVNFSGQKGNFIQPLVARLTVVCGFTMGSSRKSEISHLLQQTHRGFYLA